MPAIRVLIVDLPRMLREIVRRTVERDVDFAVIGEVPDAAKLLDVVGRTEPTFVVADVSKTEPKTVERLFDAVPQVKVLGIERDGRQTFLYELRPYRVPLGELSPEALLEVMRVAVGLEAAGEAS